MATSSAIHLADIDADLAAHEAEMTTVHGITDTSTLYRPGGTDVALADGGTGASTAAGARTNLGLVIGTDVPGQAAFDDHSARHENGGGDEISVAGLSGLLADAQTPLSHNHAGEDITSGTVADARIASTIARDSEVAAGYQPLDADLTALAGLASAADKLPYFTGSGAAALADLSSFIRTLLDDATAPAARATLQSATRRTPGYQVGQYYYGECIAAGGLGGSGANTVNLCYFIPFIVDVTTTFDRIACYITVNGSAGSVVRMGIYNDSAGVPGTVLLDAGTVATDAGAAAIKAITISQQLTAGTYWLAVVAQVAAPTVRRCIPLGTMQPLSSDFNGSAVVTAGVTGALANNPALGAAAVANPTTVALRALSSP